MSILVSDSAAEESLQAYTSPLSLQAKALDDLSEKVLNGAVVSDGNNPFTFLTEFASNMTADIVTKACECFNSLYPENAQTATELYKHLSDFDYVGLYATPATTTVELVFNRNFLIDNAVKTDTDSAEFNQDSRLISGSYSKIVLPSYSKFTVGDTIFGLMYPIEIRVRKAFKMDENNHQVIDYENSVITVQWDTTYKNPLMPLSSHILEHRDFVQDGLTLTAIEIPIYQFEVSNNLENAIASTGFSKRYNFKDRFYAVRIFHFKGGQWNELNQTFSDTNYDVDIPTAIVKVLQDIGKLEITIPHIYFNSTDASVVLGNRLLIKIYTTKGEMNVDLTEYQVDQFQASFLLTDTTLVEEDKYSSMLKRIPTIYVLPLSTRISSGTNGITFQDLKNRVKYNNSYTVKITPSDLDNYFHTSGYKFTKELDNITDRVYCAHKTLLDGTGSSIASGTGIIPISSDMLDPLTSTDYKNSISILDEDTFTIHPSALYKYNETDDSFSMLTDGEKENLLTAPLVERVNEFNSNLYTYSPFHIVVANAQSTPIASVYDLYNPVVRDVTFVWENEVIPAGISIYKINISVNTEYDHATGFALRVSIFRTANLENIPIVNSENKFIHALLTTETSDGLTSYLIGEYEGKDKNNKDVFVFDLNTQYQIDNDGNLKLTNFTNKLSGFDTFVPIKAHTYQISFFLEDEKLEDLIGNNLLASKSSAGVFEIPTELEKYTMLSRQAFTIKLGDVLPLLQSNITLSTTDAEFKAYDTMQFATYQAPIYERWSVEDYKNKLCTIEKVGTLKYTKWTTEDFTLGRCEEGQVGKYHLIVKHDAGDVIVSSPYSDIYNQVCTLQIGDDLIENLELVTPTASSSSDNVWVSLAGDICVTSSDYPEFTGIYRLTDSSLEGLDRVWEHTYDKLEEVFDISVMSFNTAILPDIVQNATFYSSNHDLIKEAIVGLDLANNINTSAKDDDRKWYLMTVVNNAIVSPSFDFETYTGYVLEYGVFGNTDFGYSEGWHINHYTNNGDPEFVAVLQLPEDNPECTLVYAGEDDEAIVVENALDVELCEKLKHDPYCTSVISHTTALRYVTNETGDTNAVLYRKYALDNSVLPIFKARCYVGNQYVSERIDPWAIAWSACNDEAKSPTVTRVTKNYMNHKLTHMSAGRFMLEQARTVKCLGSNAAGQQTINKLYREGIEEYIPTTDNIAVAGKKYYEYNETQNKYVESNFSENAFELKISISDSVPTATFVVALDKNHIDASNQYEINASINYSDENGNEVGTTTANGALYYRDYSVSNFDYEQYGLTIDHILSIFAQWKNYGLVQENDRYQIVIDHMKQEYGVVIPPTVLRKIVSDTEPCYYFPWKKIVTCGSSNNSSINALESYIDSIEAHDVNNCAGYVSLLSVGDEVHYFNFIGDKNGELSINPKKTSWIDIDKWPWEYTTPWVCLTEKLDAETYNKPDVFNQVRDDLVITYNNQISCAKVLHDTSDLILSKDGNPIILADKPRKIIYGIDSIQCDYKLRLSEDAAYANYLDDVRALLRSYLLELKAITPSLLARTKLYFTPIRTFGNAEFKGSSGESRVLPVQCSMELGLHIESYVSNSVTKKNIIRDEIINLILKDIKDGDINLSALAKTIMKELNDDIVCVDVLGINGDKTLQTLIPVREDCYPQLKQILVIHDDGTIHADRDLSLNWYVLN